MSDIGDSKRRIADIKARQAAVRQGATFGFSDELYGGAKGLYDKLFGEGDFSGTYARERDAVRAANDRAQEANPSSYFAGELAGGVALPGGVALKAGQKEAQLAKIKPKGMTTISTSQAGSQRTMPEKKITSGNLGETLKDFFAARRQQ